MLCSKTFVLDCNQYKSVFVILFVCVAIGEWREDRKERNIKNNLRADSNSGLCARFTTYGLPV